MKITGFRPLIVSQNAEEIASLFEELGFEKRHTKRDVEEGVDHSYAMKDADGHYVNVTSSENMPRDLTIVSMNVDNFQEAYDFLIARGFTDPRGDKVTNTGSSVATMLISPSGFPISISEHIRNRD